MFLKHKKVLLIAPHYHYLHTKIIEALEKQGAEVKFYAEISADKHYVFIRKFTFSPLNKMLDEYYLSKIVKEISEHQYDIFFLIRGGLIDEVFLKKLRVKLPKCQFIMYQWDSMIHNDYLSKIKYFDKTLTFDKVDARKYNIDYLPLFFTEEYASISDKIDSIDNDIIFIGTYHTHRLKVVKLINNYCAERGLRFKYHLYISWHQKWLFFFKGKIAWSDMHYFVINKLSLEDIINLYEKSTLVLDVEMTNQTGLTIRTLEALGANRKLLTTNQEIKNSDLFDENFIQILDVDKIDIDKKVLFLEKANSKYQEYHIDRWLQYIIIDKNKDKV